MPFLFRRTFPWPPCFDPPPQAVSEVASISEVQFVHPAMERICRTKFAGRAPARRPPWARDAPASGGRRSGPKPNPPRAITPRRPFPPPPPLPSKPEVEAICEAIVARVEANGGAYVEQARLDASGRAFANFLCTAWCGGIDGTGGRARAREERVREMQRLRDELKRRRERAMADEL